MLERMALHLHASTLADSICRLRSLSRPCGGCSRLEAGPRFCRRPDLTPSTDGLLEYPRSGKPSHSRTTFESVWDSSSTSLAPKDSNNATRSGLRVVAMTWDDSGAMAMWTAKNRGLYGRSKLRYPSDLTDEEWTHVEPVIPPAKVGGNRRRVNIREVVNGIMYILSTGCQWRAIPKDLPPTQHSFRLSGLVEPRRHAGSNASCALCSMPQPRRPPSESDRRHH